jgi:hypothetical protein
MEARRIFLTGKLVREKGDVNTYRAQGEVILKALDEPGVKAVIVLQSTSDLTVSQYVSIERFFGSLWKCKVVMYY